MMVTIELPPELEDGLVAQAEARGVALSQYVQFLLREQFSTGANPLLPPAERAAAWRESVRGLPHTPPLSDESISRKNIYGDRA